MFQSKYWNQKSFPKSIIRNTKSITNGLMHSKIIICTNEEKDSEIDIYAKDVFDGYIYCGSHNTTQSAWGTWTVKEPRKLKITNWELGIVFPFSWGPGFQIPFEYPAPCYQSGDEPWCIHDFAKNS
jgi:tyrosyl-DNA phosphodiesterase-1